MASLRTWRWSHRQHGERDMQISLHFYLWAVDRTWGLGTDEIKTFLHWYLKRVGYRRIETAAGMKEAESSFSLEKFYHGKMKNRIPEIVWMCFSDYGTIWWKIFFVGSLFYRDSVGRGRTGKERVRCKLWLISMHIPLISVSFGGKCRKLPFDYFPHKLAIVKIQRKIKENRPSG